MALRGVGKGWGGAFSCHSGLRKEKWCFYSMYKSNAHKFDLKKSSVPNKCTTKTEANNALKSPVGKNMKKVNK